MRLFCTTLLVMAFSVCSAQNLIPNPGFESVNTIYCGVFTPPDFNASVNNWVSPTNGSPDLYSTLIDQACWNFQPNSTYSGPIGFKGTQTPRTGNVMAGFYCYTIAGLNQREYIQTALTTALLPGHTYHLSFYVSLGDNIELSTNSIGAFLSTAPLASGTDQPLSANPQVLAPGFVTDVTGWTEISGNFQATAADQYLTIGNFSNDANTATQVNPGGGTCVGCYGAYYFIDDISLTEFVTGINEQLEDPEFRVFYDPVHAQLTLNTNSRKEVEVILYDVSSRKLAQKSFTNPTTLSTEGLAGGLYFYQLTSGNRILKNGKIIIK